MVRVRVRDKWLEHLAKVKKINGWNSKCSASAIPCSSAILKKPFIYTCVLTVLNTILKSASEHIWNMAGSVDEGSVYLVLGYKYQTSPGITFLNYSFHLRKVFIYKPVIAPQINP